MKYDLNDLLTTGQAGKILNRSVDTLRRWHLEGTLVPVLIDQRGAQKNRYYSKDQIAEFKKLNKEALTNASYRRR